MGSTGVCSCATAAHSILLKLTFSDQQGDQAAIDKLKEGKVLYTVPKGDCMVAPLACMYERVKRGEFACPFPTRKTERARARASERASERESERAIGRERE